MIKYVFTLLKVLASILGLLVAVGTTTLIVDAASIRTADMSYGQEVDLDGNVHLYINITLISSAYIFEARDGNLTLYLKTDKGEFVDRDTKTFDLGKGESVKLSFELVVPSEIALDVEANEIELLLDIYLSFWEAYGNFRLMNLSVKSTVVLTGE